MNSSTDDTRGPTPYLDTMGPQRFKNSPTFAGSDSTGYNTAHIFRAGGREWLLLAMDWRTSAGGFAWANQFISDNSDLPVILTTHEIAGPTYEGPPDALARMRRPVLQESLSKETYRHCVMAPAGALGYLRARAGRISAEAPVMSQLAESSPAACCSTAHVITAASATWAASTVTDTRT